MTDLTDPLALAQALIRRPSVAPEDAGALDVLIEALERLGFACRDLTFREDGWPAIRNLYARRGAWGPTFCYAGHTDVAPPGQGWSHDPFGAEVIDGVLYGRGACDMKGAIAAFVAAVARLLKTRPDGPAGSISLLITGDEERDAVNGTKKVLKWMEENGETIDLCVVGEPTNPRAMGEMVKIGRRGSLSGHITVHGAQGHVAYPHLADNPTRRLIRMLGALNEATLDAGSAHFQATNLEITTIDVGNAAANVIPGIARASFNIRFNDLHTGDSLSTWIRETLDAAAGDRAFYELRIRVSGESFLTPPGDASELLAGAIRDTLGVAPELSTSGGTSDARFIKDHAPVIEFGLVGASMHKVDERCSLKDMEALTRIYVVVLDRFFSGRAA